VGRETILVVEDEDTVRRFARRALERHGFRVLEAASPREALDLAGTGTPVDVLVTDVVMPGGSGLELALQFQRQRPRVRVLYISGYPRHLIGDGPVPEDLTAALLAKPFTSAQLLERVEAMLRGTTPGAITR
jgi:DNA-binding response OmpR family regulator